MSDQSSPNDEIKIKKMLEHLRSHTTIDDLMCCLAAFLMWSYRCRAETHPLKDISHEEACLATVADIFRDVGGNRLGRDVPFTEGDGVAMMDAVAQLHLLLTHRSEWRTWPSQFDDLVSAEPPKS